MKIVIVNKSDKGGGAAVAAKRLMDALLANGIDVSMLVQQKFTENKNVHAIKKGKNGKYIEFLLFVMERLYFYFYEKSKSIRFAFSPARFGQNIAKNKLVADADIIHIHWFNQGYLSLKNLRQLLALNKPVVWTLHDMWAFTGGCHYTGQCENYKTKCGNCKFLKKPKATDLSYRVLNKKAKIVQNKTIQFVTCSQWLAGKAGESALLKNAKITSIPNPIDTNFYIPKNKHEIREKRNLPVAKKLILFGAASITDERKGLKYLLSALELIKKEQTELASGIEIVLFGKSNQDFVGQIPFKVHLLGVISSEIEIVDIYNAADVFVLPSLEDNLPNTVMESMACGTPVVAFNTGGIPEMIDHKTNGYLADYKSTDDLKAGILYALGHLCTDDCKHLVSQKVRTQFNQSLIATNYLNVYNSF
jgi:glycosyltransferase involved in cell wall biosynthesis